MPRSVDHVEATRGLIFISVGVDRDGQSHRILRA